MAVYLDSSAIVKLVVREKESLALRRFLRNHPLRVASALARVEVVRAVRSLGPDFNATAHAVLARLQLLRVDDEVLMAAALLDPRVLRSLDAIHLASAQALGSELEAIVTYDFRMADAARVLGLTVLAPS